MCFPQLAENRKAYICVQQPSGQVFELRDVVFDEGSASGPSRIKFDETDPNTEETQPLAIGLPPKAIENANDSPGDDGETTIDNGSSDEESVNEELSEEVNNDENVLIHAPDRSDREKSLSAHELSRSSVEGQVSIERQVSRGQGHGSRPGRTSDRRTGHAVAPPSPYPVPIPTPAVRRSSRAQKMPIRNDDSRFFVNAYVRPTLQENEPKDNGTDDLPGLLEVHGDEDEEDARADVIESRRDTSSQHACRTATATPLDSEPLTYSDAVERPDADLWQAAMASELKTFEEIGLYQEVKAPPDHKIIDLKWVFKIKRGPNGEIDKYKARLVANVGINGHGVLRLLLRVSVYHCLYLSHCYPTLRYAAHRLLPLARGLIVFTLDVIRY